MRVALDTNVLVYGAGIERAPADLPKIEAAKRLLMRLGERADIVIPVQVLGELFSVLVRSGASRSEARARVLDLAESASIPASSAGRLESALDLAAEHGLQIWDALILSAAADAGALVLLSEDMHPGFTYRGTVLVNPFDVPPASDLARLLAD